MDDGIIIKAKDKAEAEAEAADEAEFAGRL
jgi:hypothetical protein